MPTFRVFILLLAVVFPLPNAFAQKVKVGYDKSVDFSKFTTYSWLESPAQHARPLLYASMVSYVDYEMDLKGLTRKESDGDLVLIPTGGVDFGLAGVAGTPFVATYSGPIPTINSTMWTGAAGESNVGTWVAEGELVLTLVERSTNREIWSGSVQEKLDRGNKAKSLDLMYGAVEKLFKQFPPKKK